MQAKSVTWESFAKAALATARMLNVFGWDNEVASEYTRSLMHRCQPDRALSELRRIASGENRLASATEIVQACRGPQIGARWITFSREIIGKGTYSFARKALNDGSPAESHLMAGETLIDDTAAVKNYSRVTPEMREELKVGAGFTLGKDSIGKEPAAHNPQAGQAGPAGRLVAH